MAALSPADIAVPAMVEAELAFGSLKSRDPLRSTRDVEAFLAPIARLPFDSAAAQEHARVWLSLAHRPIGERDLIIASVALAHSATLVTHNLREFARIDSLQLEDWTIQS
jgi:tRNA(fMet)-specific endonuclease VapC